MSNLLVLVDSSYFITCLRQRRDPFVELTQFEFDYEFAVNGIVWAEVVRGRSDTFVRDRFEQMFSTMMYLELTSRGHQRAARLAWDLDRAGEVIPLTDLLIGTTALEHGAMLLTFDQHFQKIPGLTAVSDLP